MAKRVDAETKRAIVNAFLADETATYKELGKIFGVTPQTAGKIVRTELGAGNGIKHDRRKKLTDEELDRQHAERMAEKAKAEHPRTSDWMDHITPLHQRKMELENAVEHKQVELEKAKQELRDFLATLKQLMEENV